MSWLFSRALVAASLGENSWDGERSAPLSVMSTAHSFWRRGKTIAASNLSLFGLTCAALTERRGEELLTSFRAGFRAKTSAPQEKAQASTGNAPGCGATWRESLAKYDPNSRSWKTAQCSLLADSEQSLATWPRRGSMRNGECFLLRNPVSDTSATASGFLLPTPSGVNGGNNNTMGRVDEWGGSSNPLRGTVIGSMCSPEFEEMVMGWPITWTELTPFAMAKFQEWQREHGKN